MKSKKILCIILLCTLVNFSPQSMARGLIPAIASFLSKAGRFVMDDVATPLFQHVLAEQAYNLMRSKDDQAVSKATFKHQVAEINDSLKSIQGQLDTVINQLDKQSELFADVLDVHAYKQELKSVKKDVNAIWRSFILNSSICRNKSNTNHCKKSFDRIREKSLDAYDDIYALSPTSMTLEMMMLVHIVEDTLLSFPSLLSLSDEGREQAMQDVTERYQTYYYRLFPAMVALKGGRYEMGCSVQDDQCQSDEKPQHRVTLDSFSIGKHEVTFGQYDFYCQQVADCQLPDDEGWGRGTRPVINVSWNDAEAYIRWLKQQTDEPFRLCTEAEWEYAARAGSSTKYYWGNQPSGQHANGASQDTGFSWADWPDDDFKNAAPVGSYKANAWGLYDMSGNVYEWVGDWYGKDYYRNSPTSNPQGPAEGTYRVLRGGSWDLNARCLRSGDRSRGRPDNRGNLIGFRLCLG